MMLKLNPVFKDYLWGGTKLKTDFGYNSSLEKVAESWVLSCHKDGESTVKSDTSDGVKLSDMFCKNNKAEFLGTNSEKFDFFPVLIKLIDAKDDLSVQVHPDNDYALRVEGEYGKTECWYILDCDEGAELIYGFKKKISSDEFRKRINDNTFLDVVNKVKVHKGDFFFIEAGTLHAIGKGILLCEIQQNSNTTYRVYDYGRRDKDGNLRPLHIEKAIDVTNCDKPKYGTSPLGKLVKKDGFCVQELVSCELFTVNKLDISSGASRFADNTSFVSLIVTEGSGEIACGQDSFTVHKGDSIFISAGSGEFSLKGKIKIIETRI